jgi:hypothetical protein
MYWLLIIIAIVALTLLFKFKEVQHKVHLVVIAGLLLFVVLSVGHVYKTHDVDLTTFDGVATLGKYYMVWANSLDITLLMYRAMQ